VEYCVDQSVCLVCLSVCLSACISQEPVQPSPTFFQCMFYVAVAEFSYGSVIIYYALPALRMTSHFIITGSAIQVTEVKCKLQMTQKRTAGLAHHGIYITRPNSAWDRTRPESEYDVIVYERPVCSCIAGSK